MFLKGSALAAALDVVIAAPVNADGSWWRVARHSRFT